MRKRRQQGWTLWQRGRGRWSLEVDPRLTDGVAIELELVLAGEKTLARWCLSGSGRLLGRVDAGQC
jgi:hypothetical protein